MSGPAADPAELEAEVALRDGSIVHLRPIRADDEADLLTFLRELSDDDRRMRFFSLGNDLPRIAHEEVDVDYVHSLGPLRRASPMATRQNICAVARAAGVGAIAIAGHRRTGVARLLLGSVTNRTLQHSTVPVLVIRPVTVHQTASECAIEKVVAATFAGG